MKYSITEFTCKFYISAFKIIVEKQKKQFGLKGDQHQETELFWMLCVDDMQKNRLWCCLHGKRVSVISKLMMSYQIQEALQMPTTAAAGQENM